MLYKSIFNVVGVVAVVVVLLVGCGGDNGAGVGNGNGNGADIYGTWVCDTTMSISSIAYDVTYTYTFKRDGTYEYSGTSNSNNSSISGRAKYRGTFTTDGSNITITIKETYAYADPESIFPEGWYNEKQYVEAYKQYYYGQTGIQLTAQQEAAQSLLFSPITYTYSVSGNTLRLGNGILVFTKK